MNGKRWSIGLLVIIFFLLVLGAVPTILVDPFFHFHKPLSQLSYVIGNQRYQNSGIVKHFTYDAVITGTSMSENFKTSEMDDLFGTNSIKVCFSGGSYKEITDNLDRAFEANSGIRYVIRAVDCNRIYAHKNAMDYEGNLYPDYLYDRNPFNDVRYIFNKEVLFGDTIRVLAYTNAGLEGTTFDEYNNWHEEYNYGKEEVLKTYHRQEEVLPQRAVTDVEYATMRENIGYNLIEMAIQNPDTQFYYFFSPYSIVWWDSIHQAGEIEWYISLLKEASRIMAEYDNIHLFSFFDETDVICDLSYYKDAGHYSGDVNSMILRWMEEESHRLTASNYEAYWDAVLDFYSAYDYDSLFAE